MTSAAAPHHRYFLVSSTVQYRLQWLVLAFPTSRFELGFFVGCPLQRRSRRSSVGRDRPRRLWAGPLLPVAGFARGRIHQTPRREVFLVGAGRAYRF